MVISRKIIILLFTALLLFSLFSVSSFAYYDFPNGSIYPNVSDYVAWLDWFEVRLNSIVFNLSGDPNYPSSSFGIYQRLVDIYNTLLSFDYNLSLFVPIDDSVSKLTDFFANSNRVSLEEVSADSVITASSIYSSSPNGSSVSHNMGDLGGFSSSISSDLNTGVSAGEVFDILDSGSDGDGGSIFGLFSDRAKYEMDPSLNSRSSSEVIVTDYFSFNSFLREIVKHF